MKERHSQQTENQKEKDTAKKKKKKKNTKFTNPNSTNLRNHGLKSRKKNTNKQKNVTPTKHHQTPTNQKTPPNKHAQKTPTPTDKQVFKKNGSGSKPRYPGEDPILAFKMDLLIPKSYQLVGLEIHETYYQNH